METKRKNVIAGSVIAIALLLLLGKWVIAARQDAADQKASQDVEQKFVAARAAANGSVPAQRPAGMRGGAQGGPNGGRRRWGGGNPANDAQREQRQQQRTADMAKEVGLSAEQTKQMQAIQQSSRPMMMDVFRNPKMSREEKRAAMQTIRQAQQAQITKIMTADQQTKYTAYREKMRAQWQGRRGPGSGPNGPGGESPNGNAGNGGSVAGGQNG